METLLNKESEKSRSSSQLSIVLVSVSMLAFPILIWVAIQATTNTQDLSNWIDKSSNEYARYQTFIDRFGTDDDVVVSWQDCTAENPDLLELVRRLREGNDGRFERVVSGTEALNRLRESASNFSDRSARRRLRGSLFGDNLETSCAVIGLSPLGRESLSSSIDSIVETTSEVTGLKRDKFHVVGKAVTSLELNRHTNKSLPLGIPGAILAALVACIAIGNVRMVVGILWTSGFGALFSLATVTIVGVPVNGLLVLMPVLVFVLSLGGAVHMARAWQSVGGCDSNSNRCEQMRDSLKNSRPPILVSFLTTAVGFATLCFSSLPAVFQFGLFSAVSLLLAMALLLFLLPATWFFLNVRVSRVSEAVSTNIEPLMLRLVLTATKFPKLVLLMSTFAFVAGGYGLSYFEADLQVNRLFAKSTQVAIDNAWFEENLFSTGRVELVVSFPREKQMNRFQQLMVIRGIQSSLRKLDEHHSALSVANFVAIPQTNGPLEKSFIQQFIATQITRDAEQLNREGMLSEDERVHHWRISVACTVDKDRDELANGQLFLATAKRALGDNINGVQLEATGLGPVSASGQRRLFNDLVRGLLAAIFAIVPILMLTLRRFDLGLIAMLPNLFPLVVVFGYCGWVGKRMDIGAILTASVGLGIAIDDTLHFLHFERIQRRGSSFKEAPLGNSVNLALRHCWAPVTTTTVIICVGLSPFLFSQFLPIKNFAICLSALMLVALLADLVLLPALLGGSKARRTAQD